MKSSQPNGLELSEVSKIFISRFPQLLRVQIRHLRYLNVSTLFEECFWGSFGVIRNEFVSFSSLENSVFKMQRESADVSLKSPQPNGHWFLKYIKFLFCLFSVFYGSTLDQWGIQKYGCNQENIFGIVLEQ